MSVKMITQVWEHAHAVKGDALVVLLALADYADDEGFCWPKIASVAQKARLTEDGTSRIVKRLEEEGFVAVVRGVGRGNGNRYKVRPRGDATSVQVSEPRAPKPRPQNPFSQPGFSAENPAEETPFPDRKTRLRKGVSSAGAYKDEPSVLQPPIEPSVCERAHESDAQIEAQDHELRDAVLEVCGMFEQWRIGSISLRFRLDLEKLLRFLESQKREARDILDYRRGLPAFLGKPPQATTAPTPGQMLDNFERVLSHAKALQEHGSHHTPNSRASAQSASEQRGREKSEQLGDLARRREDLERRQRELGAR